MAMLNNQRVDYNDVTATSLEIVKKLIGVEKYAQSIRNEW